MKHDLGEVRKTKSSPPPKRKTPAAGSKSAVSTKIPRSSYRTLQQLAKREQRTITATIARAIEHYRAIMEGNTR
jgi:hypothetical protein